MLSSIPLKVTLMKNNWAHLWPVFPRENTCHIFYFIAHPLCWSTEGWSSTSISLPVCVYVEGKGKEGKQGALNFWSHAVSRVTCWSCLLPVLSFAVWITANVWLMDSLTSFLYPTDYFRFALGVCALMTIGQEVRNVCFCEQILPLLPE